MGRRGRSVSTCLRGRAVYRSDLNKRASMCAAAIEIDPIHCAVHEFNFPNCAVVCADASKIDAEEDSEGGIDEQRVRSTRCSAERRARVSR